MKQRECVQRQTQFSIFFLKKFVYITSSDTCFDKMLFSRCRLTKLHIKISVHIPLRQHVCPDIFSTGCTGYKSLNAILEVVAEFNDE